MPTAIELGKQRELHYDDSEIQVDHEGISWWATRAVGHELKLKIVGVPDPESDFGIASFVVMEQDCLFLQDAGRILAETIHRQVTPEERIGLVTVEAKGLCLAPHVWRPLHNLIPQRLVSRIVTVRKGKKVYMEKQIGSKGRESLETIVLFYRAITSHKKQKMVVSPEDIKLLDQLNGKVSWWVVEDFIGEGGTLASLWKYFNKLGFEPPKKAVVVGSDSDLYLDTFRQKNIGMEVLRPFLLKLPTFRREIDGGQFGPWQVNEKI